MSRLDDYLPPILKEVVDLQNINKVAEIEIDRIQARIKSAYDNLFILSCDEETIIKWEEVLNITPIGTIEDRRKQILLVITSFAPYTRETLKEKLNTIAGINGYDLFIDYAGQNVSVLLHNDDNLDLQIVKNQIYKLFLKILPAHLTNIVKIGELVNIRNNLYVGSSISIGNIYDIKINNMNLSYTVLSNGVLTTYNINKINYISGCEYVEGEGIVNTNSTTSRLEYLVPLKKFTDIGIKNISIDYAIEYDTQIGYDEHIYIYKESGWTNPILHEHYVKEPNEENETLIDVKNIDINLEDIAIDNNSYLYIRTYSSNAERKKIITNIIFD